MTQRDESDTERAGGVVTSLAGGPRPPATEAAGTLSAESRAIALIVEMRFILAHLRLQLRDVELDRG